MKALVAAPKKYPDELRERAVRLYRESDPRPTFRMLAEQLGVHHEALRNWVRQAEADKGERHDRPTTDMLAENLWSTIKIELLYWPGKTFATRTEAEHALIRYLDGWYNPRRIQARLGGLSPDEYEDAYRRAQRAADR